MINTNFRTKRLRQVLALLFFGGVLMTASYSSWAAESWVTDPKSGCGIGWVSETQKLVTASWSGNKVLEKAEGKGVLLFVVRDKDGKTYQGRADGEMVAGKLDGEVSVKWSDGESFNGSYRMGVREGRGLYKWVDGSSYEGEWKDNRLSGKGLRKWPNGQFYEGDFKNGRANGRGTMKYSNGATYEGDFVDDRPGGNGVLKNPRGAVIFSGVRKNFEDESMQKF